MSSKRRLARLREEIQRELASIIEFESRDPVVRDAFPTVMEVRLSPDARHAKVYVAAGADTEHAAFHSALVRDRGFYRSELAERLSLRHTPELQFVVDEAVERSIRLGELLREDDADLGTP
jgi:ribosome-binding factor A